MMRGIFIKICLIFAPALLFLASLHSPALAASDEDLQTLGMFYEPNDLVVSATRNPKPLSQAAENITIITAKEIEMMGAHTLVDVLANVPGIQVNDRGGPGNFDDFYIQGEKNFHILVMLDGVTLNQLADQFIDPIGIPLQIVERIEIVKGPGSSSWGSALGGVINIVTKSPLEGRKLGGTLSFTAGERGMRDTRGEFSGTIGQLGYYLFAGNLTSQGFRPNTAAYQNDIYAKLRWEFPEQGSIQFTIAYDRGVAGDGDTSADDYVSKVRRRHFLSTLSFNYPINDRIDLDLSLRTNYNKALDSANLISTGEPLTDIKGHEVSDGGSAKVTWRGRMNTLAAGFDYDHLDIDTDPNLGRGVKLFSDKYGVFLNDTLAIGDFSVTSGFRYDRMRQAGDFYSPSLGVAWNPTDKITLRAYWARGYGLPALNPDSTQQKVTTVQAGVETTYIPWLWIKATIFWNQLSDVQNIETGTLEKQLKQGVEVEGKTVPIFNTSFSAGYTFIDGKNRETGEPLIPFPRQLVKVGIHYNDLRSLRGALFGRYVCGNSSFSTNAKSCAMLLDLN
ncbi:MAG TPA: TonB-dependent receptor, partial [Geobacteraceae bacterium]|nr:TonB-dependent receptor [Geobacteraceae bacterium]